jgi:hypothetical protein
MILTKPISMNKKLTGRPQTGKYPMGTAAFQ